MWSLSIFSSKSRHDSPELGYDLDRCSGAILFFKAPDGIPTYCKQPNEHCDHYNIHTVVNDLTAQNTHLRPITSNHMCRR